MTQSEWSINEARHVTTQRSVGAMRLLIAQWKCDALKHFFSKLKENRFNQRFHRQKLRGLGFHWVFWSLQGGRLWLSHIGKIQQTWGRGGKPWIWSRGDIKRIFWRKKTHTLYIKVERDHMSNDFNLCFYNGLIVPQKQHLIT